jgi:hypothetical protein
MAFSAGSYALLAAAQIGSQVYQADQARSAQNKASDQAKANATKQATASDEAQNAANAKGPNTGAILSAVQQMAKGGASSTMLTGPSGVDPSQLTLGKSTLLGGTATPPGS